MNNDAIIIPGESALNNEELENTNTQGYLTISGSLKEIKEAGKTDDARTNLCVYSKGEINDQIEHLGKLIDAKANNNSVSDLSDTLETIQRDLNDFVKKDGSISFTGIPTVGEGENKKNLITENKVNDKLKNYATIASVDDLEKTIDSSLKEYIKKGDVYNKKQVYTQDQVDNKLKQYLKSEDLKKPLDTVYPKLRTNISTKGYVDDEIKRHKNEANAHNFETLINNKLSNYYRKAEVFTKAQTYSRILLDDIIDKLVSDACKNVISNHISNNLHLSTADVREIIKLYAKSNLVDNESLNDSIDLLNYKIEEKLSEVKPIWKTSGPVLTTVGFVEDNTELPAEMTMQDILDAIFYGSKLSLIVDTPIQMGETTNITMCIHSGIPAEKVELYQNGELIESFFNEDFEDGCVTITSKPLTEDTEFTLKVIFSNGLEQEQKVSVKVNAPVFAGLLPEWKPGHTLTMDYLKDLERIDSQNNKFITDFSGTIEMDYSFKDKNLRHPFVVIPATYPDLKELVTKSLNFGSDAFNIINMIPFRVCDKDITYTVYVYNQALSSLNQTLTFNFESNESAL